MTNEEYPCKHCKYGIYTIIGKKWWCDLYDVYAPQVARNISEPFKHSNTERQKRMTGARNGRIEMRLIDADAMKDTNDNVIAVIDPETKSKYWISLNDYINAQPTVDTIKHAHWVRVARSENEYWQCSNCHGYFTLPMPKYRGFYMRYCGCCGAEMDEVAE